MNKDRPVLGRLGLDFFFFFFWPLILVKVSKDGNRIYYVKRWTRRYL